MDAAIDALAKHLRTTDNPILRQGVVTAVAAGSCSVKWGNATVASPSQKALASYVPVVGHTVWGIRDGDDMVVLGLVGAPSWSDIAAAGAPAPSFINSWANYAGYHSAGYLRDAVGFVHLRGVIKLGSLNNYAFYLPAGYRPAANVLAPAIAGTGATTITIQTDGGLYVSGPAGATNASVTLDGITYPAAP